MTVAILLPDDVVHAYGVREGELLEVTFTKLIRGTPQHTDLEIFPRTLRIGRVDKQLSSTPAATTLSIGQEPLRKIVIQDKYYSDLLLETNLAFTPQFQRSPMVLFRVLLENVIVDLLRAN